MGHPSSEVTEKSYQEHNGFYTSLTIDKKTRTTSTMNYDIRKSGLETRNRHLKVAAHAERLTSQISFERYRIKIMNREMFELYGYEKNLKFCI